jgi:hypothetical protein
MKYPYLIILLLISNLTFAQLQETNETILINGEKFSFTLLSYSKYSKAKPAKVFTCDKKNFEKIKLNIRECYKKYKIQYTDFYVIPIDKIKCKNSEIIILEKCLQRIDEIRISKNLSTIQIQFNEYYDKETKDLKITYEKNILVEINKIENLYQNINVEDVCYEMSGRK